MNFGDKVKTPDGCLGTIVEFDTNEHGGRDVRVYVEFGDTMLVGRSFWYYKQELVSV